MQEALTVAGWMAVAVFVLAALADGRAYRVVRALLAALAWTIDKVRELKARYRNRRATTSESRPTSGDVRARRPVSSAASPRATSASTWARDTPTD